PNLANLPRWGTRVWVHDPTGLKLDMRAHEGRWVGFDAESGGHQIYLTDRRMVAVERNVSFERRESVVLGPGGLQVEGERKWSKNSLQVTNDLPEIKLDAPQSDSSNPSPQSTPDPLGQTFDQPAPMPRRSTCQRTESPYLRMLRDGVGTHDGHGGDPIVPQGIQAVEARHENEGEKTRGEADEVANSRWELEESEVVYAMFAGTCEAEGLEPQTLEEARKQPDWSR
ncbi:hypothetical protein PAXINDRAFT_37814, partial [Paxillus involutus ATCC 200175]